MIPPSPPVFGPTLKAATQSDSALREAAVQLEATFLAEMLKSAGLGAKRDQFGGGAGEDQFGSFLVRAQADIIAENGGIGLAESLFKSLLEAKKDGTETD